MTERKPRKIPEEETWSEAYNCHTFIKSSIPVDVSWASVGGGYQIKVCGQLCSEKPSDVEEGKILALLKARRLAKASLDNLNKELEGLYRKGPKRYMELYNKMLEGEIKWEKQR